MKALRLVPIATLTLLAACAGTPRPGDAGYPYNLDGEYSGSISVVGQEFSGILQLTTAPGGVVSGTLEVTQPVEMGGPVEGTLVNDKLTVRMSYENNPLTGCSGGSMTGTLTVAEDGMGISGSVTVDDCGQIFPASVSFRR